MSVTRRSRTSCCTTATRGVRTERRASLSGSGPMVDQSALTTSQTGRVNRPTRSASSSRRSDDSAHTCFRNRRLADRHRARSFDWSPASLPPASAALSGPVRRAHEFASWIMSSPWSKRRAVSAICERSSNPVARDRRKREHVRYLSVWLSGRGLGQGFGVACAAGAGLGVVEPVGLAFGLDDPAAMGESVEGGAGEAF